MIMVEDYSTAYIGFLTCCSGDSRAAFETRLFAYIWNIKSYLACVVLHLV